MSSLRWWAGGYGMGLLVALLLIGPEAAMGRPFALAALPLVAAAVWVAVQDVKKLRQQYRERG